MYVNGYYSEWFEIKSGVAQGCPLSPLLFLVVAEALNASLAMERKIEGIDVKGKKYKLSQFADDTSPLLGSVEEIPYVDRALRRWCRATGMRENCRKPRMTPSRDYDEQRLGILYSLLKSEYLR